MGADGGTIPRRDELVREKKKPEKKDKASELKHRWNDCCISQLPLQKPVLACEYGNLYNKESLLELLLEKQKFENLAKFSHIRNLKDVKELNLHDNPALSRTDDKMDTSDAANYVCPVTGLEMNGKHRFCFIWTCGCVMSERALKEVRSTSCHKCGKAFVQDDVIILNGDDEDFKKMKAAMEDRRIKAKLAKKSKKKAAEADGSEPKAKKSKEVEKSVEKPVNKDVNGVRSKEKAVPTKKPTSVQKDPNASQTYKSLFTSSDEAKSQKKQHSGWISFNPQYFR